MSGPELCIRSATAGDAALIHDLLRELADYSGLSGAFRVRQTDISRLLFSSAPRVFGDIAEVDGEAVGVAIWFYNINTFEGQAGLYLEDLYVRQAARGTGTGRALMTALARRCCEEGLASIEWSVMAGNELGLDFYAHLGAAPKSGWIAHSLSGQSLQALAAA
jgi:GNAT superfamily N-acetyltransferase